MVDVTPGSEAAPYQVMPGLSAEEFDSLKRDVAERGVLVPIEVDELGNVLDGHHRLRAWDELRQEGVKVAPYPRVVRRLPTEDAKVAHALRLNLHRRHLDRSARRVLAADLRRRGWSLRRIAAEVGADPSTVGRDLAGVADATPDVVEGSDGKHYRVAVRRSPAVVVHSDREEVRAREALTALGETAPERPMDLRRAEARARRVPGAEVDAPSARSGASWSAECADFRSLTLEPESVDLIVTDPPYDDASLPLFSDLGLLAARVLRPGRLLVCYAGSLRLPEAMDRLGAHLDYVWTAVVVQPGRHSIIRSRMIRSGHRSVLIFSNGGYRPGGWIFDTVVSELVPAKHLHPWEQSIGPVQSLVEHCSRPGELVLDPMMGSGTTGVAALRLGRRFIGCDVDPQAARTSIDRLDAESKGAPR